MIDHSGFHEGERSVQDCAGEAAIAERNIALLSDTVIGGARPFIAQQSMVVLGSVDRAGAVWASMLFGQPGFLQAGDGRTILVDLPHEGRDPADPLWDDLAAGRDLGMLFIELASRRRYRVNGSVRRLDRQGIEVAIREAYPNCPKYIQRRQLRKLGEVRPARQATRGTALHGAAADIVRRADTLFVASRHPEHGADASHRGGHPGFVQVLGAGVLRIPDYIGNSLFNTLGNFEVDPRAGICIPDFENGQLLQLSGSARVLWNQPDPGDQTGGTRRYWEFALAQWILRELPQPMEWEYYDASPFNPGTA